MTLFFLGCSSNQSATSYDRTRTHHSTDRYTSLRSDIVSTAKKYLHSPYQYGAKGPKRFDCSGLVYHVYQQHQLSVNGSAEHISDLGTNIDLRYCKAGDLVFYKRKGKIFHVSIVTKNTGKELWVIHSTSSKGVIQEDIFKSTYWRPVIHKVISLSSLKG